MMNETIETMNKRIALLRRAIRAAEKDAESFPPGRLRINKTAQQIRYYQILEDGDSTGKYLPKKEMAITQRLSQKYYNKLFLKTAKAELKLLEKFVLKYGEVNSENVFDDMSTERRNLAEPYILSDELFAVKWQSEIFKANPFMPENKKYDTRRGEKVRSKSEAIIADILYELGIPYRYECPLQLMNRRIIYPDFTMLRVKTREEVHLEHFGLLDDDQYLKESLSKLDEYRSSGIYPGKNLLFTYETEENPLDIKGTKDMLRSLLC